MSGVWYYKRVQELHCIIIAKDLLCQFHYMDIGRKYVKQNLIIQLYHCSSNLGAGRIVSLRT